jgi:hypothetical protein
LGRRTGDIFADGESQQREIAGRFKEKLSRFFMVPVALNKGSAIGT